MAKRGRPPKVRQMETEVQMTHSTEDVPRGTNEQDAEIPPALKAEMEYRKKAEQNKRNNPVVDEWYQVKGQKVMKCQRMKNRSLYRTYIGTIGENDELLQEAGKQGKVKYTAH